MKDTRQDIDTTFIDIVNENARERDQREYERRRSLRINQQKREQMRRMKLQKIKTGALAIVVGAGVLAGAIGYHNATKFQPKIPEGYERIFAVEQVDLNESLWDIAESYWDSEVYGQYYEDIRDFIKAIKDVNDLKSNTITPYQNLIIPCFIDENNIFLEQKSNIESQIKVLPRYVDYTVKFGDTLLGLAFLGAGDTNEAYEIKEEIQRINNLSTTMLVQGTTIKIVNPEIGELKKQAKQYEDKVNNSLKVNVENDDYTK